VSDTWILFPVFPRAAPKLKSSANQKRLRGHGDLIPKTPPYSSADELSRPNADLKKGGVEENPFLGPVLLQSSAIFEKVKRDIDVCSEMGGNCPEVLV
jgi:hypothetical protein